MDSNSILFIGLAVLALLAAALVFTRRKAKSSDTAMVSYIDGLRSIISGDHQTAFVKLRQAVDLDTENIDAYLKLGDMFREKGMVDKAIQIHRELTLRKGVSNELLVEIKKSMALDYIDAEAYEHAIEIVMPMIKDSDNRAWAEDRLLDLYISVKKWKDADSLYKSVLKKRNIVDKSRAAGIKVMIGLELAEKQEFHKARLAYKDALALDNNNPLPYLYISDSYIKEKRTEDGLQFLKKLCENAPKFAFLGFSLIEETLFSLGRFGEIEDIYRNVLNLEPGNLPTTIALAGILEKKGEVPTAENMLRSVLESDKVNVAAAIRLAKMLSETERASEGLEILSELAERFDIGVEQFECDYCGYRTEKPEPVCPDCGELGTFFK